MCIARIKDGPKRVKKTFSMILEKVFERGENGITSKMIFEVEVLSPLKITCSKTWSFSSSSSFSLCVFLCSVS
jgi:hypothetical protein